MAFTFFFFSVPILLSQIACSSTLGSSVNHGKLFFIDSVAINLSVHECTALNDTSTFLNFQNSWIQSVELKGNLSNTTTHNGEVLQVFEIAWNPSLWLTGQLISGPAEKISSLWNFQMGIDKRSLILDCFRSPDLSSGRFWISEQKIENRSRKRPRRLRSDHAKARVNICSSSRRFLLRIPPDSGRPLPSQFDGCLVRFKLSSAFP